MVRRARVERGLAVVGVAALLVVGFDAVTYAATGSSLLLGRVNKAGTVTTVANTGNGAALALVTRSPAYPPFTTNAKGLVPNLFAGRAATADRLGGLTIAQVRAGAIPPASATHLVGQPGEPLFGSWTFGPWGGYGSGYSPVSFRKDQLGVVHVGGLGCPVDQTLNVCSRVALNAATGSTLFTLPVGYRPAARTVFVVNDTDGFGRVDVLPDGEVQFQWPAGSFVSFVALDGISFVASP
jgi:hypothetical protein